MAKVDVGGLERRFEEPLRSDPSALSSTEVADRVLEAAGRVRDLRVLDAGCGTGELSRRLADRGARVSGIDLCAGLVARAQALAPDAGFARADAQDLPFGTGRFDLAASVLVLHYLADPARAVAELARILPSEELEDLLRRAGFEVLRQVEFRRVEALESWVAGTDPARAGDVREEVARLRGRDLGGFRVAAQDRVELRMALMECRPTY